MSFLLRCSMCLIIRFFNTAGVQSNFNLSASSVAVPVKAPTDFIKSQRRKIISSSAYSTVSIGECKSHTKLSLLNSRNNSRPSMSQPVQTSFWILESYLQDRDTKLHFLGFQNSIPFHPLPPANKSIGTTNSFRFSVSLQEHEDLEVSVRWQ